MTDTALATATAAPEMVRFRVLTHDVWGNARDGWEVNQSYRHGVVEIPADLPRNVAARRLIAAIRALGLRYESHRMASLSKAWASTPYMGGHVDLCERNGKPVGYLERLP